MKPMPIREVALKKAKTILWPWVIFGTIEIVMISKFGNHETTFAGYVLYTLLQVKGLHESLWFFPSLFLTLVFSDFLILRLNGKILAWVSCGMLLGSRIYGMLMPSDLLPWHSVCLPWHIHNVGTTVFFVILGYLYREYKVNEKIKKYMPIISIMCIGIYLIELYITRNTIEIVKERIEGGANERAVNEKSQYCFFVCTTFDSFLNDLLMYTLVNHN